MFLRLWRNFNHDHIPFPMNADCSDDLDRETVRPGVQVVLKGLNVSAAMLGS